MSRPKPPPDEREHNGGMIAVRGLYLALHCPHCVALLTEVAVQSPELRYDAQAIITDLSAILAASGAQVVFAPLKEGIC